MGEAKLYGKSVVGLKIDGIEKIYSVYTGQTIKTGNFVEFIDGAVRNATTSSFNGIAKTSGSGGDTIKVYVPNI